MVAVSFFILPTLVSSTTALVDRGPEVQAAAKQVPPPLLAVVQSHAALFAQLGRYPANAVPPALLQQAAGQVGLPNRLAAAKYAPLSLIHI